MPSIQTRPTQILAIWKFIHGPLPRNLEADFLNSDEVQRLSYFSWEVVRRAINSQTKTLTDVIQQLELLVDRDEYKEKSRAWIRENSWEIEQEVDLQPGTYQFLEKIYSVRTNKKSRKQSVLLLDSKRRKFVKLDYESDENRILRTLTAENRLTLAQATKLSNEWGVCCHCGRILTATRSVGKGMGPICEQYYE